MHYFKFDIQFIFIAIYCFIYLLTPCYACLLMALVSEVGWIQISLCFLVVINGHKELYSTLFGWQMLQIFEICIKTWYLLDIVKINVSWRCVFTTLWIHRAPQDDAPRVSVICYYYAYRTSRHLSISTWAGVYTVSALDEKENVSN